MYRLFAPNVIGLAVGLNSSTKSWWYVALPAPSPPYTSLIIKFAYGAVLACVSEARKSWKPVKASAIETRADRRARRRGRGAGMKGLRWMVRDDSIERGRGSNEV